MNTLDNLIGKGFHELFANHSAYKAFRQTMEEKCGVLQNFETKLKHLIGHEVWTSFNAHSSNQGPDLRQGFEGTMRDVTENKLAADALFQEKDRLYVTLDSIGDGVIKGVGGAFTNGEPFELSIWIVSERSVAVVGDNSNG